jgi:Flp pilus assembly protein TadG
MPRRAFQKQKGQALVEWTLVMPIFLLFAVACFQFTVIWWAYISTSNVVRDGTRWLAVHPHTTDSTFTTMMHSRLPSNLTAANLTLTTSPACASLSSGVCVGRTTGAQLSVTGTYNISGILFLPSQFGWEPWRIQIPTSLPPFTMYMPVEPV